MKTIELKEKSFWGFISEWFSGKLQQSTCALGWWAIYGFLTFPLWIFPLGIVNIFIRKNKVLPIHVSIGINILAMLIGVGIGNEWTFNPFLLFGIGWGAIVAACAVTAIIMCTVAGIDSLIKKLPRKQTSSSFIKEFLKGQKEKHCSKIYWK